MKTTDNEETHNWAMIDDGQTVKLCPCGVSQADDGTVVLADGSYALEFPACTQKSKRKSSR